MTVESFIATLSGAGADLQVEDILDALWLATRGRTLALYVQPVPQPATDTQPPPPAEQRAAPPEVIGNDDKQESALTDPGSRSIPPPEKDAAVYAAGDVPHDDAKVKASPVALPAAHALAGRLQFGRALRPFRQRWPSRHEQELDEEETVETTAALFGQWYPVFRPRQERWFDVDVVLEDDPAIGVWRDTMRDFCQVLRETGAFRDVHSWRLRMPAKPDATMPSPASLPLLESSAGGRLPARALGGSGARRLVFFVTHGSSERWLDGSYARLIAGWSRGASVLLLHLLDRKHWKRGLLGEPHGLCYAEEPGAVASTLRVERFWWSLGPDKAAVRVPAAPLTPQDLGEWAHMQMARGRRSSVFLLDSDNVIVLEKPAESPREYERAVALLRESSPEAFRLAVALSAGAFTLPVARLVQEARFGAAAQQQHLAEVLLSGLVFARSAQSPQVDPNELYYEFYPDARTILLRSLREADANSIAAALERRVSQYLEEIEGRAITFRALVADQDGNYDLPQWAQPFARLGLNLLGGSSRDMSAAQLIDKFRTLREPGLVAAAAQLAAALEIGAQLDPSDINPVLWEVLRDGQLLQQDVHGAWTLLPGIEPMLREIASTGLLRGVRILWVDDHKENNEAEIERFLRLSAGVHTVTDTKEALLALKDHAYDVIISDMVRGSNRTAGHELLQQLSSQSISSPVIIYAGQFAAQPRNRHLVMAMGAFACTNEPQELLELILEATGRSLQRPLLPRERQILSAVYSADIDCRREMIRAPHKLAESILQRGPTVAVLEEMLKVIRAVANSQVNHLIRVEDRVLHVIAALIDPRKKNSRYVQADWWGLIGRAVREGQAIWAPDVDSVGDYLRNEPDTRSELVLPLMARGRPVAVGVVNIEMDMPRALEEFDISWLDAFCAPLAPWLLRFPSDKVSENTSAAMPVYRSAAARVAGRNDYAIVVAVEPAAGVELTTSGMFEHGALSFADWLVDMQGGNLPNENVWTALSEAAMNDAAFLALQRLGEVQHARRLYLYLAGAVFAENRRPSSSVGLIPYNEWPVGMVRIFEFARHAGLFTEIVVVAEKIDASASSYSVQRERPSFPSPDLPACFYVEKESRAPERILTRLLLQGLRGSAESETGEIRSASLVAYLTGRVAGGRYAADDIVFLPARAFVNVLLRLPSPAGTIRITEAEYGEQIAAQRLNESSCRFRLAVGKYRASHVESGLAREFEVGRAPDHIEVLLVDGDEVQSTAIEENRPPQNAVQQQVAAKRIVLALEGGWSDPVEAKKYKHAPSNLELFCEALNKTSLDGRRQLTLWSFSDLSSSIQKGFFRKLANRVTGGAVEANLWHVVMQGYEALAEHYEPGDEIFLLGYGRTAYVACELAWWLQWTGLVKRDYLNRSEEALQLYRESGNPDSSGTDRFRASYSHAVSISFLGLWEHINYSSRTPDPFAVHPGNHLPSIVRKAFHALAIDESRSSHLPHLWSGPPEPGQQIEQRWFVGSHTDICGGYRERGLSDVSLCWMKDRAMECSLSFDRWKVPNITAAGVRAPIHKPPPSTLSPPPGLRKIGATPHGFETVDPSALQRHRDDETYAPANLVDYLARAAKR